jgi:hypothetical protein
MPKTKISEFSSTPASNTDIDSINIAEGCAPSGINDAIRELMAQLKDFQTGAVGDSFNGPVGTSTAAAGAFTTLSASSTVSGTGFSTYLASPPAIGGTAAAAVSATTLTTSSTVTLNGGTANGVAYLNGSKVVTSGSALTFDGTNFAVGAQGEIRAYNTANTRYGRFVTTSAGTLLQSFNGAGEPLILDAPQSSAYISFNVGSTEQMRLTSTGLGIGTTSPAAKVDAFQSSVGTYFLGGGGDNKARQLAITSSTTTNSGDTHTLNAQSGTGVLAFAISSSEKMRLDTSGNLGLGVTPSAWNSNTKALQVNNAALVSFTNGTNVQTWLANSAYYDNVTGWIYKNSSVGAALYAQNFDGAHSWQIAASGTAGNAITFTQAMTLDASGNLGIGTTSIGGTSSNRQLTVVGSSSSQATFTGSGSFSCNIGTTGSVGYLETTSTAPLTFYTNSAERARIDSSGNLLVGTTNSSPSAGAGVKTQPTGKVYCVSADSTNSSESYGMYSTGAANYRFYVGWGGTVYATSTTITAISDQRLKENIRDLDEGLATVMALKPRKFDWKVGKGADIKNARGFIAQEFETVLPDMIETWKDPAPEGEEPYKAINANLIPTLVKAIQELKAEFDAYKASHP